MQVVNMADPGQAPPPNVCKMSPAVLVYTVMLLAEICERNSSSVPGNIKSWMQKRLDIQISYAFLYDN